MSLLDYFVVITLLLTLFPLAITEMKSALVHEDIKTFSVWVFVTCFLAGLPFMVMTLATVT
ncbi:hypothetical protein [Gloeocapsopsis dulcis]|uniref:Uncharacterized protein n=1 Tax=Gloeocapsopsis dulcis AAB1 = 1H9 TaxID=1433147 RepID=A0A6N8FSS8_9CHRO|nr:hypothetical protein [Gloeocapsopsis dulcis]MUL35375.1 hypothetical protein [Gloeocapsopsis dulcis AAB1 = 1H9]WNN90423.1 hypothetical protein P0S91_04870 [Gloeocapsopsis dulcis]